MTKYPLLLYCLLSFGQIPQVNIVVYTKSLTLCENPKLVAVWGTMNILMILPILLIMATQPMEAEATTIYIYRER